MAIAESSSLPEGWFQTGRDYLNYATGIDETVAASGSKSVYVKSLQRGGDRFGAIMQTISPPNTPSTQKKREPRNLDFE